MHQWEVGSVSVGYSIIASLRILGAIAMEVTAFSFLQYSRQIRIPDEVLNQDSEID